MTKKLFLIIWLFLATAFNSHAATTLNGVYVGAQLYLTPFNGMQIDYIVYYFHPNGTFNDEMNAADWRTKISGSYSVANGMIQLKFTKDAKSKKYKLAANGSLESTAGIKHSLHKVVKVAAIPAGTYERKSASTSGGMNTGMPMVGAFSSNYLTFDGQGNFSSERQSVVGVSGDGIAGKSEKNGRGAGTYKLGDGEITLTYNNGKIAKHSFFYSPPDKEDLVLVDGEFYFREDENKKRSGSAKSRPTAKKEASDNTAPPVENTVTAAAILSKMRALYGGDNIDKLTTIREVANMTGNMQITSITDIANKRVRAELRQNGKLLLVKQLDADGGWQWVQGNKKPLSAQEVSELELGFYQGVLGLHKKLNSYLSTGTVTNTKGDYMITFNKENGKLIYLVDSDYRLKGTAYTIGNSKPSINVYKNFTQSKGIGYPATTEFSDGTNKIITNTTNIEFNPILTEDSWKVPVN